MFKKYRTDSFAVSLALVKTMLLIGIFICARPSSAVEAVFDQAAEVDVEILLNSAQSDFHGRIAVLPMVNLGNQSDDWMSALLQSYVTQLLWHLPSFDTRSPRALASQWLSICPALEATCLARVKPEANNTIAISAQLHSYISGSYSLKGDEVYISLIWHIHDESSKRFRKTYSFGGEFSRSLIENEIISMINRWLEQTGIYVSSKQLVGMHATRMPVIGARKAMGEAQLWLHRVQSLGGSVDRYRSWQASVDEVLRHDPELPDALHHSGWLRLQAGESVKSLALFEEALSKQPYHLDAAYGWIHSQPFTGSIPKQYETLYRELADRHAGTAEFQYAVAQYMARIELHLESIHYSIRSTQIDSRVFGSQSRAVAAGLTYIGLTYADQDYHPEAHKYQVAALNLWEELYGINSYESSHALSNLVSTELSIGQFDRAVAHAKRVLHIEKTQAGDGASQGLAQAYNILGLALFGERNYDESFSAYTAAESVYKQINATQGVGYANVANNVAILRQALGDDLGAIDYLEEALSIITRERSNFHSHVAELYVNLGQAYASTGQNLKAIEVYTDAIDILQTLFGELDRKLLAPLLLLNESHRVAGRSAIAVNYRLQALEIMKQGNVEEPILLAEAYRAMGVAALEENRPDEALDWLMRAHQLVLDVRGPEHIDGYLPLFELSRYWWDEHRRTPLAIFYASQAVNLLQAQRLTLAALSPELQESYRDKVQFAYRHLADLLLEEGRIGDSERVLELLKDAERVGARASADTALSPLPLDSELSRRVSAIDLFYAEDLRYRFLRQARASLASEEEAEFISLSTIHGDSVARNRALDDLIGQLDIERIEQTTSFTATSSNETFEALSALHKSSTDRVAVLYLFANGARYNHLLITKDGPIAKRSVIDPGDLARRVASLRRELNPDLTALRQLSESEKIAFWSRSESELRKTSQKLYNDLIGPIAPALEASGADTLLLYVDGVVRYLPLSILHDGSNYLISRFRIARVVGSMVDTLSAEPSPFGKHRRAAFGTDDKYKDEEVNFAKLHNIEHEIEAVTSDIRDIYFRERFVPDAFYNVSAGGEHAILHIATHFHQGPGSLRNSYWLFGGPQKINAQALLEKWQPQGVELLTLSACSTALATLERNTADTALQQNVLEKYATGAEAETFAGEAIHTLGVKSVISTLWDVDDRATARFMRRLYSHLSNPEFGRAAALREAQLDLLLDREPDTSVFDDVDRASQNALFGIGENHSHPYFWSPFVLMGKWR